MLILCPILGQTKGKRLDFCNTAASPRALVFPPRTEDKRSNESPKKSRTPGKSACLADEARGYEEALGAPERVVEVGAVGLELRGQPAVQHEVPAAGLHPRRTASAAPPPAVPTISRLALAAAPPAGRCGLRLALARDVEAGIWGLDLDFGVGRIYRRN